MSANLGGKLLKQEEVDQLTEIYTAFAQKPASELTVLVNSAISTYAELNFSNEVLAEVLFMNSYIFRQILAPQRQGFDLETTTEADNILVNLITINMLAAGKLLTEPTAQEDALFETFAETVTAMLGSEVPLAD